MATRFVYAKGLDLMMESFEEFCKQDDEWQLDIIGAGDLWNQIVADAKRRGIEDRVNFVGYTNEPEKYYLNSSVFPSSVQVGRMADGYHGSLLNLVFLSLHSIQERWI